MKVLIVGAGGFIGSHVRLFHADMKLGVRSANRHPDVI